MLAVGAALGGLVTMAFGRNISFLVDACSFLLSAFLVSRIRSPFSEAGTREREHPPFLQSMRETFSYARTHSRVLALLTSKSGFGIGGGVVAMLSIFGREVFRAGAVGIGVLYAARGIGALVGPFLVRWSSRTDDSQYRKISFCGALFGLGYIGLAFSPTLLLGALFAGLGHVGGGAQWQTSTYGLQREVPDRIRGRVFAADYGLVTLTMSVSGLIAGMLSDRFGPVIATASVASLCLVWSLIWGFGTRKLWT
jgi:MFS family permease